MKNYLLFILLIFNITINMAIVPAPPCPPSDVGLLCATNYQESSSPGSYICNDCFVSTAKVHYYYPDPTKFGYPPCSDGTSSPCEPPSIPLTPPPCGDGSINNHQCANTKAKEIDFLSNKKSIDTINTGTCVKSANSNERICTFPSFFDCTYYGQYTAIIEFNHSGTYDESPYDGTHTNSCWDNCDNYLINPNVDLNNPNINHNTSVEFYTKANLKEDTEYYQYGITLSDFETNTPTNSSTPSRFVTYFCNPSGIGTTNATLKISKQGKPTLANPEYITKGDKLRFNLKINNNFDYRDLAEGSTTNIDSIRNNTYVDFYLGNPCPQTTLPCNGENAPPKNNENGRCDAKIAPPCLIDRIKIPYLADKNSSVQITANWDTTNLNTDSFGQKELWIWIDAIDSLPPNNNTGSPNQDDYVGGQDALDNNGDIIGEHADLDGHDGVIPQPIPFKETFIYSPDFNTNDIVNNQINFEQSNLRTRDLFEYGKDAKIIIKSKPNLTITQDSITTSLLSSLLFNSIKIYKIKATIKNDVPGVDANYTADAKNVLVNFKINSPIDLTTPLSDYLQIGTQTIDVLGSSGDNQPGITITDPIFWIDFNVGFNVNVEVNPNEKIGRVLIETNFSDNNATKNIAQ